MPEPQRGNDSHYFDNEQRRAQNRAVWFYFLKKNLEYRNFGIIFAPNKRIDMRIIAKSTLVAYYTKNPKSKTALEDWYEKTRNAEWTCYADIKRSFNSVDSVGNKRYVFNIKGNDYRLVVIILFTPQTVYIRFVGTHDEYDKITDIKTI